MTVTEPTDSSLFATAIECDDALDASGFAYSVKYRLEPSMA